MTLAKCAGKFRIERVLGEVLLVEGWLALEWLGLNLLGGKLDLDLRHLLLGSERWRVGVESLV